MQTKLLKGRTPLYLVLLLLVVAVMLYLRTHSGGKVSPPPTAGRDYPEIRREGALRPLTGHTHGGVPQRAGDSDRGGAVSWFSIDGIGQTEAAGGNETRPRNIAVRACIVAKPSDKGINYWIKAYGKVTNAGVLDASTLAADIQRKANRDEVAPKAHTHRAAEINDFAEAVAALTVYQKIGTFDICKLPDGTQIESGTVRIQNHANSPTARVLTWPLAFISAPVVVATLSAPEGNVRDIWVTIDNRQSNQSAVHYWLHEPVYNTPDVTVNFVAVGRWK